MKQKFWVSDTQEVAFSIAALKRTFWKGNFFSVENHTA